MSAAAPISSTDLAIAAMLLLADAALSLVLRLGVARSLLIAGLRALVQLLVVGMVLDTVFALQSPWLVAGVLLFMFGSASYEVYSRQQRRFLGAWGLGMGAGTMMLATLMACTLAVLSLELRPWWSPQGLIPITGMMLGIVMNGVSLALNAFTSSVTRERQAIEARLALGATRHEALGNLQRDAVRSGVIPAINQMNAAGIITLPGMMTGQILAGASPFEAAKYQILVMFLMGGAATLGAIVASYWAVWRITDERDRLLLDRLHPLRRRK